MSNIDEMEPEATDGTYLSFPGHVTQRTHACALMEIGSLHLERRFLENQVVDLTAALATRLDAAGKAEIERLTRELAEERKLRLSTEDLAKRIEAALSNAGGSDAVLAVASEEISFLKSLLGRREEDAVQLLGARDKAIDDGKIQFAEVERLGARLKALEADTSLQRDRAQAAEARIRGARLLTESLRDQARHVAAGGGSPNACAENFDAILDQLVGTTGEPPLNLRDHLSHALFHWTALRPYFSVLAAIAYRDAVDLIDQRLGWPGGAPAEAAPATTPIEPSKPKTVEAEKASAALEINDGSELTCEFCPHEHHKGRCQMSDLAGNERTTRMRPCHCPGVRRSP